MKLYFIMENFEVQAKLSNGTIINFIFLLIFNICKFFINKGNLQEKGGLMTKNGYKKNECIISFSVAPTGHTNRDGNRMKRNHPHVLQVVRV